MAELPADILSRIARDYPGESQAAAVALVTTILPLSPRVVRCVLHLAAGDMAGLQRYVKAATEDPRDVMFWAEYENHRDLKPRWVRDLSLPFARAAGPAALQGELPMNVPPLLVVALCVLINMIDGFDILALTFAAPVLVREWGLTPDQTGLVFSANLLGIAVGAFLFALIADVRGRRPVILFGTLLMSLGMLATAAMDTASGLAVCRVVTGLGIGAMVSTAGTLAIEYSAPQWRKLSVALVVIGFPIGGALGGPIAGWLLAHHGWRHIFLFGGALTVVLWPLLWWRLPESREFLQRSGPPARMATQFIEPWRPVQRRATLLLCAIYPLFMSSFYFFVNWHTKLVTERGLSVAESVTMSTLWSLAGIAGGIVFGLVATRLPITRLVSGLVLVFCAGIAAFGVLPPSPVLLNVAAVLIGFFMWGASATIYSVIALSFPAPVRASGIGLVVTVGRIGSALGPALAGLLRGLGMDWSMVAPLLVIPGVLAALLMLSLRPAEEDVQPAASPEPLQR